MSSNDERKGARRRALLGMALAAAVVAVAGCANGRYMPGAADECRDFAKVEVEVVFKGNCAVDVDVPEADRCAEEEDCFRVSRRNGMIRWERQSAEPTDRRFAIFFDPLMGPQYLSNPHGCLRRRINSNAPLGTYKYTIQTLTAEGKPDGDCPVKDPKVIVSP
jgi:hypothetical protein